MIIANKQGHDILRTGETRIAFAVNTEGENDSGFAGMISRNFWPELANIGSCKLGTTLSKTFLGITFYALVCYSLYEGWQNQTKVVQKCFDAIECSDIPVATVSFGTGFIASISGADFEQIKEGMKKSKTKIILY